MAHFKVVRERHLLETFSRQIHSIGDPFQQGRSNQVACRLVSLDRGGHFHCRDLSQLRKGLGFHCFFFRHIPIETARPALPTTSSAVAFCPSHPRRACTVEL